MIDGDSSVGGFTGYGCVSTFNRCWANVDVTCNSGGGGFTGGGGHYNNCYALGDVAGGITSGGFCGWISGTYTNCYSVGQVNGGADVGIGFSVGALGTFTNCFWDMDTSGQSTSGGSATGKTTVNMYKEATFTNWNFVTVWQIVEDTSYPTLR